MSEPVIQNLTNALALAEEESFPKTAAALFQLREAYLSGFCSNLYSPGTARKDGRELAFARFEDSILPDRLRAKPLYRTG